VNSGTKKDIALKALEAGIDAVIVFPVSDVELEFQIRSVLKNLSPIYQNNEFNQKKKLDKQKRAEQLLEEKEKNYRNLFEDNPQPMWIYEPETLAFLKVNKSAKELYGYSENEFLSMKITQIFASEEIGKLMHQISSIKNNSNYYSEWRHLKKNGEIIHVETTSYTINFENRAARYVLVRDKTKSKQVYLALQEKNERLKHAQEIAKMGSWQYDLRTQKASWSDNNFRIYGLEPGEIEPTWDYALSRIHSDDLPEILEHYQNLLNLKKPVNTEFRLLFEDGSVKWIQNNSIPHYENGQLVKIDGVNIDVTSRKETEHQLIDAKEKAQESDRLKSAFLANMSHEIRTPMNGIIGFLDLIHAPGISPREEELYYKMVKKSSARLLNTIDDIVEISKIESGQLKIHLDYIDVQNELFFLHNFFEPEAKENNIGLKINLPKNSSDDYLISDKIKFRSILTNLIKNAIKFTKKGFVEFGYNRNGNSFSFFVNDTGVGIPKNRIHAIFDRFVQANLNITRAHEGLGLGLSIARAYTELLGGEIRVKSEENKGSCFIFTLDNNENNYASIEKINPRKKPGEKKLKEKQLNILVVEDDEINWSFINTLLKKENHNTVRANTGQEAIQIMKNNKSIDLILMDVKLSDMDGNKATRMIREFNREIPIIAQTAYSFSDNYEKMMDAGCNDYLSKPIKAKELLTKIMDNVF
ncbi:MAG: PAS domain-containing protein, partial [Tangfeifania sp.]